MKILLISPCTDPDIKTPGGLMLPQLALYILEGLSIPKHDVRIVEEESEVVNLEEECDLVGISCMTANATRAYFLASEFRKRGRKVILGGVHPTILPEEALKYADSVVIGEAEGVWEQILEDLENGRLQNKYRCLTPSLERYIPVKYKKSSWTKLFNVIPIISSRGCPYDCEFCCVSNLYGKKIRHVPIGNITRSIEESNQGTYMFMDDNIVGDPVYAIKLFQAIKPLKIKWAGQSSVSFVNDAKLMKMAAESGCKALFFGLESVSAVQLQKMRKSIKEIHKIEEAIKKIKDLGIHFHASFVFGFDNDTKEIFDETLEFLEKNKIGTASFNILTPYPGTKIYEQFKREGRLITDDWKYYDHSTVVFKPKNMTPYELQAGEIRIKKEFTKMFSIIKRFPGSISNPGLYLSMNYGIRQNVKADIKRLPELTSQIFVD